MKKMLIVFCVGLVVITSIAVALLMTKHGSNTRELGVRHDLIVHKSEARVNAAPVLGAPPMPAVSPVAPSNLGWNTETVIHWMQALGPARHLEMTGVIVATALAAHTPVASNAGEFVRALYYMVFTNDMHMGKALGIIGACTNDVVADVLLDVFTNDFGTQYTLPECGSLGNKYGCLLSALGNMDTPEIMDKLNKVCLVLAQNKNSYLTPSATISPDKYPEEARNWLFNYPLPSVRDGMANAWYWSERPDAAQVLRDYIKTLKALPLSNPYWDAPEPRHIYKRARIKEIQVMADRYARQYRRWLKDKKRMPLHSGLYQDDGWDMYSRMSEEERRQRWGKQYGSPVRIKGTYQ